MCVNLLVPNNSYYEVGLLYDHDCNERFSFCIVCRKYYFRILNAALAVQLLHGIPSDHLVY